MKRFYSVITVCLLTATFSLLPKAYAGPLDVKEIKLKNGMTVWLNEDHSQPKVFGAVVVRAGAVDTPNEGIAHYFEHIMFKGTDRLGTKDYEKEKPLLDSISDCYDRLAKVAGSRNQGADSKEQAAEIQKEINRLNIAAAEYAIPNEFNRLINLYGGSGLNAATSDDITFYHNVFSPQYMPQWLELNSHRLINPVYRLFQGELETVYEEKNMYADEPLMNALDEARAKWFGASPYAYPIIGSTENLKNPRMSRMSDFYKTYYVANNMALILAGDFNTEEVESQLEATFGRIPSGPTPPKRPELSAPRHSGETVEVKLPIPLISAFVLLFDFPCDGHADEPAMKMAMTLLSNDSETGLLDHIMTEKKALAAGGQELQFDGAGVAAIIGVPNLLGSSKKLEEQILLRIDSLKAGLFSDETFASVRESYINEQFRNLETIDDRSGAMMDAWTTGKTWEGYLASINNLRNVTKQDVVAAANKYLTRDNFMRLVKKYGNPKHDKLSQPGYKPVAPKRDEAESEYAKALRKMSESKTQNSNLNTQNYRLVDLKNDAAKTPLSEHANLYTVKNPIDSLYTLHVTFYRGSANEPLAGPMVDMLNEIGTESMTRSQINEALLKLNATMSVSCGNAGVTFTIKGHDKKFREAVALLAEMINKPKADKESFRDVIDGASMEEQSFKTNNSTVFSAILSWLRHGENSSSLTRVTKKELKKMTPEQLLALMESQRKMQMAVTYSGALANGEVEKAVREMLPIDLPTENAADYFIAAKNAPTITITDGKPTIYFYNMPKSRQSLIGIYSNLAPESDERRRVVSSLWGEYFGGDMSSVMFQELREYRALCYACGARATYPQLKRHADAPGMMMMMIGTQADKTMTAIDALDSLVAELPLSEPNFEAIKASKLNSINHDFPSFRDIGSAIAKIEARADTEDAAAPYVRHLPTMTLKDIADYHNSVIRQTPKAYIVVGDKKSVDMKALARRGNIVYLKDKEIFKK